MLGKDVRELDQIANLWNKTRDEKYRVEWYRLVKKLAAQIPVQSSVSSSAKLSSRKSTLDTIYSPLCHRE